MSRDDLVALQQSHGQLESSAAGVGTSWNDTKARATRARHIVPGQAALVGLAGAARGHAEQVALSTGVADDVTKIVEGVEHTVDRAEALATEAETGCESARASADTALTSVARSNAHVERALRLLGLAGEECGAALGAGAVRQLVGDATIRSNVRATYGMAARAFAVEAAVAIGPQLLVGGLERVTGSGLPHLDNAISGVVDEVRDGRARLGLAQLGEAVGRVRSRLGL